jgi:hypothetical protein
MEIRGVPVFSCPDAFSPARFFLPVFSCPDAFSPARFFLPEGPDANEKQNAWIEQNNRPFCRRRCRADGKRGYPLPKYNASDPGP